MEISAVQLDRIYDSIDRRFREGRFEEVDELLVRQDFSFISTDNMLAYLSTTLPAKNRLKNRRAFFERTKEELKRRGEYEDTLLSGLES